MLVDLDVGETRIISNDKLTLIESRMEVGEEQAVPLINQAHNLVSEKYSHIPLQIFDCPPGTSCPMVAAVKKADFVVLVTEPTPFGLNDLKLAVETVAAMGIPFGVLINRDGQITSFSVLYLHEGWGKVWELTIYRLKFAHIVVNIAR